MAQSGVWGGGEGDRGFQRAEQGGNREGQIFVFRHRESETINDGDWKGFGSLGDDWDMPLTMHTLSHEVAHLIGCYPGVSQAP